MASMQTIDRSILDDVDTYYRDHTHVHSLLAHDDEIRFPDGTLVDDEDGTLTLQEWREIA